MNLLVIGIITMFLVGVVIGYAAPTHQMSMEDKRTTMGQLKTELHQDMLPEGQYKCCLEKPCASCLFEKPSHGDLGCDCLSDVINGKAPCAECIGEILEGKGNPYLAQYFAKALSEELGEQHAPALKQIISETYNVTIDKQL